MPRSLKLLPLLAAALLFVGCDSASTAGSSSTGSASTSNPDTQTSSVSPVSNEGITPVLQPGNTSGDPEVVCKSLQANYWAWKVESPRRGTFTINNFTFTVDSSGRYLTWQAIGTDRMRAVFVKGGRDTFLYSYDGSLGADGGLRSPDNGGGNIPGISNFIYCFTTDSSGHGD